MPEDMQNEPVETQARAEATPAPTSSPAPAAKPAAPPDDDSHSITAFPPAAQELIRQLRSENAGHRQEARRQRDAAERAEREKLAQAGEWKQAYERVAADLEPLKAKAERAEAIEAFMTKTIKARIEAMPEQFRKLVPHYDDPLKTLQWLDESAPLLMPPKAPSLDAGAQGSAGASAPLTPDERAMARRMQVTDEQYRASRDALAAKR